MPRVPVECEDWVDRESLWNTKDIPLLRSKVQVAVRAAGSENPSEADTRDKELCLEDHPQVQREWEKYLDELWLPWVDAHDEWKSRNEIYTRLFAIHQEQQRLGEEYELILGIGLFTWQTPTGQRVRRHLVVANAVLEFDSRQGVFSVHPNPEGANIRIELDMLDIEEQPTRIEESAKNVLAEAADDPWNMDCVEGVLKSIVHSIDPAGEYIEAVEARKLPTTTKPTCSLTPAIILRKRSVKGLTETLKRIKERLELDEEVPCEFGDLAELAINSQREFDDHEEQGRSFEGEVYFPKPYNEDQRNIVQKLRHADGVLVQGPPGTGKSHTIANLICHLLATGQRILVTAKTPRALQVLEKLIPEELRPLCINLLGSGAEEKRSLEASVSGIINQNESWNSSKASRELLEQEERIDAMRKEKSEIDRRLRDIRESETKSISIASGRYVGTAARIAEAVNADKEKYDWFTDEVPLDTTCLISSDELMEAIHVLRTTTLERRTEMQLLLPEDLPTIERLEELVSLEKEALEHETDAGRGADEHVARLLKDSVIESIQTLCAEFLDRKRQLSASNQPWVRQAIQDVICGEIAYWSELLTMVRASLAEIKPLAPVIDTVSVTMPEQLDLSKVIRDVGVLIGYIEKGGKLGWGPFRPRQVRDRYYLLSVLRVNGSLCRDVEQLRTLSIALKARVELDKAWGLWAGKSSRVSGPSLLQVQAIASNSDLLERVLSLDALTKACGQSLSKCPELGSPTWSNEQEIMQLIASCKLSQARRKRMIVQHEFKKLETEFRALSAMSNSHRLIEEYADALGRRDIAAISQLSAKYDAIKQLATQVQRADQYLMLLERTAPKLAREIAFGYAKDHWDARISEIESAWQWAQAKKYIEQYLNSDDVTSLEARSKHLEESIRESIAKSAALHAWTFCFSRLTEEHRRHMEAWRLSMRRLGKGTGKYAMRHRRDAQQHLNECKEAVPAWVMPLHRVWDTITPEPASFEVIIVDEASQCGLEALPLFYLAKKILIVGDDKQISPDAVGLSREKVNSLMENFLHDYQYKSTFDIESSLFDHGKLRFGTSRVTLREHFRCMPEIIRFSNDICYSDTPLIPLRQYGPNRLKPLEHVFVPDGYREGSNERVINKPEAIAIAERITACCDDPKYKGKTIGVVVLQGQAQGPLIESELLARIGPQVMSERHILCGNPYSFQGDERDIIILSMVAAGNATIGPFTQPADERRFNVAASRARDQMILFHSVHQQDLYSGCFRLRLLKHFENMRPREVAGIDINELEYKANTTRRSKDNHPQPFDSWFEVDVALDILRKGYEVIPQYEVAGKFIDLVVEGGMARVAVECYGDEWHGADKYEHDISRQRMLERSGWEFKIVRECAYYSNKEEALELLWPLLKERGIIPNWREEQAKLQDAEFDAKIKDISDCDIDEQNGDIDDPEDDDGLSSHTSRRSDEIPDREVHDVIPIILKGCPRYSCTVDSMSRRALKHLNIRTRGKPLEEFDQRVKRILKVLQFEEVVEIYRATNLRVRLL